MERSRILLVLLLLIAAASLSMRAPAAMNVGVAHAAVALQPTAAVDSASGGEVTAANVMLPTPDDSIGATTRLFLIVVGVIIGIWMLIGGGLYLRRRWLVNR